MAVIAIASVARHHTADRQPPLTWALFPNHSCRPSHKSHVCRPCNHLYCFCFNNQQVPFLTECWPALTPSSAEKTSHQHISSIFALQATLLLWLSSSAIDITNLNIGLNIRLSVTLCSLVRRHRHRFVFIRFFSLPTLLSNNQWGSTRWWPAVSCDTLSALTVWIYLSTAATRHSSELTFSRSLPTTSFALSIYLFIFRCVHLLPSTTQTMTTTTRIEPFVFHKIIIQRRCEHL